MARASSLRIRTAACLRYSCLSADNHSNALLISKSKDSVPLEPGRQANLTNVLAAISTTPTSFEVKRFRRLVKYREILVVVLTISAPIKQSGMRFLFFF